MAKHGYKTTTVDLPEDILKEAKQKGIRLQHIFLRGWQVVNGEPQLLNDVRELRENQTLTASKLERMKEKIYDLQKEIINLKT